MDLTTLRYLAIFLVLGLWITYPGLKQWITGQSGPPGLLSIGLHQLMLLGVFALFVGGWGGLLYLWVLGWQHGGLWLLRVGLLSTQWNVTGAGFLLGIVSYLVLTYVVAKWVEKRWPEGNGVDEDPIG